MYTEKKIGAKMAPHWSFFGKRLQFLKVEPYFFLIIMFEKKTVPLTKVVPFAKMAPQWSRFP